MLLADTLQAIIGFAMQPQLLLLLAGSVLAGIVLGALPGVSSTMALAVLLPITFGMDSNWALTMLLGVLVGSVYGGSIPAILLSIPGTPGAIVTQFDGHPMARQGRAGEALGLSLLASTIGGLIGLVALVLIAPVLASLATNFRSPEFTLLAALGLVLLAFTTRHAMLAGIMAGAIGVMCGMVGFDLITGIGRLDYGIVSLQAGLDLVPVIIGAFGMAEVLKSIGTRDGAMQGGVSQLSRIAMPVRAVLSHWTSVLRGSLIGTFIGAIPAAGSSIAVALAYTQEMRFAKPGARFGKGEPAGVIAPESANSALTGGSLIPVMTLGIPGDSMSAILIGGLIIHGLQPGPTLFINSPTTVAYIYAALMLAVVLTLIGGMVFIRPVVRAMQMPARYIIFSVTLLCIVGAFAIRNSIADVMVMMAFGLLGFLFHLARIPVAPLVFGLILGPIMEENFRRSLMLGQGSITVFVERPVSLAILALIVLLIVLGFMDRPGRRKAAET